MNTPFKKIFGALVLVLILITIQYRLTLFSFFGQQNRMLVIQLPGDDDLIIGNSKGNISSDKSDNSLSQMMVDIHVEDPVWGHTGEVTGGHHADHVLSAEQLKNCIAIGGGITSKKIYDIRKDNIRSKFAFFSVLLPSFCRTANPQYQYHFYLAYDQNDPVFDNKDLLAAFQETFLNIGRELCPKGMNLSIHFVQCSHQGRPAWAQNDAMMEAYIDGMEYFYRVNDDSVLASAGWTNAFIDTLASYNPPNVGVVGPKHVGGNEVILTYDFVHRTHVDVFGFYYPRIFTDWFADDWVTGVYAPGRVKKLDSISLVHTMNLGQRYSNNVEIGKKLAGQLEVDKTTLQRYLLAVQNPPPSPNFVGVVSIALYSQQPIYTIGAIRNAQLMPLFFPGWKLRVHVARPKPNAQNQRWLIPFRIINRLKLLGAQIAYVDVDDVKLAPKWWSYLIADDLRVDYFIVRRAEQRLSDRDAAAMNEFIRMSKSNPGLAFHCIRDHPNQAKFPPIVAGLWGGRPAAIKSLLKTSTVHMLILNSASKQSAEKAEIHWLKSSSGMLQAEFLSSVLWPAMQPGAICHDSVACKNWPQTFSFPMESRAANSYVGQKYDEHQIPDMTDVSQLSSVSNECSGKDKWVPSLPPRTLDAQNELIPTVALTNSDRGDKMVPTMIPVTSAAEQNVNQKNYSTSTTPKMLV